jgi:hypothetical protein
LAGAAAFTLSAEGFALSCAAAGDAASIASAAAETIPSTAERTIDFIA